MIISKTPLRISFLGGGSDISSFYKFNEYGSVISSSINKYIYVIVKKQSDIFSEKYRLNYSETELISDINEIKNPIIKQCLKFLNVDDKIYIATIADIPSSTGLGSSSSFCVGLLNALYKFKGQNVSSQKLAEESTHIEINLLNKPIGKQDQYAAAFGGLNLINFYSDETVEIKPIRISSLNFEKFFKSIIIFWSGVQRSADKVLIEQNNNSKDNLNNLIKLKKSVDLFKNYLESEKMNIELLGKLLHEGWELKKTFASNISNNKINEAYSVGLRNGAYGGKLLGAGGGGFLLFIADPSNHEIINKKLLSIGYTRIRFEINASGSTVSTLR